MSGAWTPGPWELEALDEDAWVTGPDRGAPVICDLVPRRIGVLTDEDMANGDLIAAAPDLLEALEMCAQYFGDINWQWDDGDPFETGRIHAAIAKAKGKTL